MSNKIINQCCCPNELNIMHVPQRFVYHEWRFSNVTGVVKPNMGCADGVLNKQHFKADSYTQL